jgi:hypothetical protein
METEACYAITKTNLHFFIWLIRKPFQKGWCQRLLTGRFGLLQGD